MMGSELVQVTKHNRSVNCVVSFPDDYSPTGKYGKSSDLRTSLVCKVVTAYNYSNGQEFGYKKPKSYACNR